MSALTVDGDLVHYEKLGRGRPVILLHGWIGSWRYWIPLMQQIKSNFSVYAVDLFGFGDSSKNLNDYSVYKQVRLLTEFLDNLGIPKVAFVGHGLGALVMIEFAKMHPEKVVRMMLTSMPLYDTGDLDQRTPAGVQTPLHSMPTVPHITAEDRARLMQEYLSTKQKGGEKSTPPAFDPTAPSRASFKNNNNHNPLIDLFKSTDLHGLLAKSFKRSESHYDKLKVDVDKTDAKVLEHSARHYDSTTIMDDIRTLPMPVVLVHGTDDQVIKPPNEAIWNYLTINKDEAIIPIPLEGVRHFPMLESEAYLKLVADFLKLRDLSELEPEHRWRRRSR